MLTFSPQQLLYAVCLPLSAPQKMFFGKTSLIFKQQKTIFNCTLLQFTAVKLEGIVFWLVLITEQWTQCEPVKLFVILAYWT